MTKINLGRVLLGGLLAGVVMNVGEFLLHEKIIKDQEMAAMTALGKGGGTGELWLWIVYGFVFGIALVWLYATMRPRFGAGLMTAVYSGLTAWFFGCLMTAVAMCNMDLFPRDLLITTTIAELVLILIAAVAGGWLYREP